VKLKVRRESEDRGSKGCMHIDIENPETPTERLTEVIW
jgi:hypothetical protein